MFNWFKKSDAVVTSKTEVGATQGSDSITQLAIDESEALKNQGNAHLNNGELEDAAECYRRAIARNPRYAEAHNNLSVVQLQLGQIDDSVASCRRALEIKPDLSEAHYNLGNALLGKGKIDEALVCYQHTTRLSPDNAAAYHQIASLTGNNTERAPIKYVQDVFDSYADNFDTHLQQLKYDAPKKLVALITRHVSPSAEKWNVLDLGCGTGLVGLAVEPFSRQLVGVDLSAKMLGKAHARKLYHRLERSDLLAMMCGERASSYDVIIAADVLIYLGKLEEIVSEIKRLLCPGGVFAFSIETLVALSDEVTSQSTQREYQLEISGRYSHSPSYITRLASANSFLPLEIEAIQLRMENGKPVDGYLVLLRS